MLFLTFLPLRTECNIEGVLRFLLGPEHFDECLSLIKEKSLYADALKLYQKTTQEYKVTRPVMKSNLVTRRAHES